MAIFNTFSKRQNKEKIDVFIYDYIPETFRNQLAFILCDAIGPWVDPPPFRPITAANNNAAWIIIYKTILKELGVNKLEYARGSIQQQIMEFLLHCNTSNVLDIIDISFNYIFTNLLPIDDDYRYRSLGITQLPQDALDEINHRFYENGLGYQFINGQLLRVDSTYLHEEVTKTALTLINDKRFKGVEDEFRKSHEHYLHKRYKEALNESLKAFESTMKSICDENNWSYPKNTTSKSLIEILYKKEFIPEKLQNQFTSLRSMLESGVPTIRNSQSAHGQGSQVTVVDEATVKLMLHLTGTYIVFLIDIHNNRK